MVKSSFPKAVQISKELSQLLRHSGRKAGLKVASDGFTPLHDVLNLPSMLKLKATEEIVRELVETSDKQRFALREDVQILIRANQGHSMEGIDMEELCGSTVHELNPGEVCCHGTYEKHLQSIITNGLKAGGNQGPTFRKDVHFSIRHPGDTVVSGMRQSCQIAVYVDLPRAARDGVRFYRSSNDVILSAGIDGVVPPKYIDSIWDIKKKVQLYSAADDADRDSKAATAADGNDADEMGNALLAYRVYGATPEL